MSQLCGFFDFFFLREKLNSPWNTFGDVHKLAFGWVYNTSDVLIHSSTAKYCNLRFPKQRTWDSAVSQPLPAIFPWALHPKWPRLALDFLFRNLSLLTRYMKHHFPPSFLPSLSVFLPSYFLPFHPSFPFLSSLTNIYPQTEITFLLAATWLLPRCGNTDMLGCLSLSGNSLAIRVYTYLSNGGIIFLSLHL